MATEGATAEAEGPVKAVVAAMARAAPLAGARLALGREDPDQAGAGSACIGERGD